MLEKAELTLIIMLSKTKKVITTHLIVLCSVASRKLFYSIAWRVGTLSLQFVPPAEGGGMEIIMSKADVLFVNMCKDILDNGFSSEGQAVRAVWEDGTPAHTIKKFGVVNRYNLQEELPALT